MTQTEKYKLALALLIELNCPDEILDMLYIFSLTVHDDEVKLHNWSALASGGIVEGECVESNQIGEKCL